VLGQQVRRHLLRPPPTRFRDEARIGMVWSPFLVEEIIIGHMRDTD
jgi:hypothetical protein